VTRPTLLLAVLVTAVTVVPSAAAGPSGGAYALHRSGIARGGGRATAGGYVLYDTIGQAAATRSSGGGYVLSGGFQLRRGSADPPPIPDGCGDADPTDAGEECDLGIDRNGAADVCCSVSCRFDLQDKVCRAPAGACDVSDRCTGFAGLCTPFDAKSTGVCQVSTDVCLKDATCDGQQNLCPPRPFNNGVLCTDDDACTVEDSCGDGACRPGTRVCDVSVPSGEFSVRLTGRKRTRALVVTCSSQSAGTCDAEVVVPAVAAVRAGAADVDRGADGGEVITQPLRKAKKVKAGRTIKLKLRLTPAGLTLLKGIAVGSTIDTTIRARVQNDRGLLGVRRAVALRRTR